VDLGGADQITVGNGNKIVLGGDGADTIDILGAGNRTILGDNGIVTYVALGQTGAGRALKYETTDTLLSTSAGGTAGADTITVTGDGDNTVLGGLGGDTIALKNGRDTVLGDNGIVQMDAAGNNFAQVKTLSRASAGGGTIVDLGGTDTITALSGDKIVLGGDGADQITLGDAAVTTPNERIVLGDNGVVTYVALGQAGAGKVLRYETTDTEDAVLKPATGTGAGDTITIVQNGNNTILGGMGGDTIATRNGSDTILGDNGFVQMDAEGNHFAQVKTLTQASAGGGTVDLGGDDVIISLDGTSA
jgi:Ca2+-binding RTX toxin-like protein